MTPPPCVGEHNLFDSTDPADHRQAAAICATCPMTTSCQARLHEAMTTARVGCGPEGTWAGKLYGAPAGSLSIAKARADEEAQYGEAEARACATRWAKGERDDYVRLGRRVYERRMRRRRIGVAA